MPHNKAFDSSQNKAFRASNNKARGYRALIAGLLSGAVRPIGQRITIRLSQTAQTDIVCTADADVKFHNEGIAMLLQYGLGGQGGAAEVPLLQVRCISPLNFVGTSEADTFRTHAGWEWMREIVTGEDTNDGVGADNDIIDGHYRWPRSMPTGGGESYSSVTDGNIVTTSAIFVTSHDLLFAPRQAPQGIALVTNRADGTSNANLVRGLFSTAILDSFPEIPSSWTLINSMTVRVSVTLDFEVGV